MFDPVELSPLHGHWELFRDIPTGGLAVDSEDVAEFGNVGEMQTDANSTRAQSSHLV